MRRLAALGALALGGCAYLGTARDFDPASLESDPGWLAVRDVPVVFQTTREDCGAAALSMVLCYWGERTTIDDLTAEHPPIPDRGMRAGDLRELARGRGLQAFLIRADVADLERELSLRRPVLVGVVKPYVTGAFTHYEVVVGLHRARQLVLTIDPQRGWRENSLDGFLAEWEPAARLALVMFKTRETAFCFRKVP